MPAQSCSLACPVDSALPLPSSYTCQRALPEMATLGPQTLAVVRSAFTERETLLSEKQSSSSVKTGAARFPLLPSVCRHQTGEPLECSF